MSNVIITMNNEETVVPVKDSLFLLSITGNGNSGFWLSVNTFDPISSLKSVWYDGPLSKSCVTISITNEEFEKVLPKRMVTTGKIFLGKTKIERFRELESILKEKGLI